jgi:hypothetical protein
MQHAIYILVFIHVQKRDVRIVGVNHGLINYIDTKAKCSHLKLTCERTLRQVFISQRPRTPYPAYTLHTCTQYTYGLREGGRGEAEPERRLEEQQFTKLGRT